MEYKVVKDFGTLRKGDIIKNDEINGDIFTFVEDLSENGTRLYRYAEFDKEAIDEEVEAGNIILLNDDLGKYDKAWADTMNLLNTLDNKYKQDYDNLMKEYEEGDVPTCLKVEAETVYENLGKLVNVIRDSLNGKEVKVLN